MDNIGEYVFVAVCVVLWAGAALHKQWHKYKASKLELDVSMFLHMLIIKIVTTNDEPLTRSLLNARVEYQIYLIANDIKGINTPKDIEICKHLTRKKVSIHALISQDLAELVNFGTIGMQSVDDGRKYYYDIDNEPNWNKHFNTGTNGKD